MQVQRQTSSKLEGYNYQNREFNIIADLWCCSSAERDEFGKKFDGAYPKGFMNRVKTAFAKYYPKKREDILHVCAGRIPKTEGMTLDISSRYSPEYLANAEDFADLYSDSIIPTESFWWVQSDTPYNDRASEKYYGIPLLNRSKMLQQMARVCRVGGFVALLDQISPNSSPRCLKRVAIIGVTSVPNQDLRVFTVYRKTRRYQH